MDIGLELIIRRFLRYSNYFCFEFSSLVYMQRYHETISCRYTLETNNTLYVLISNIYACSFLKSNKTFITQRLLRAHYTRFTHSNTIIY